MTTLIARPIGAAGTTAEVPLHGWTALDGLPLDAWVTGRDGGVSRGPYASLNLALHVGDDQAAVLQNRARLASAVGYRPADAVFCEQTHGPAVAVVDASDRGRGTLTRHDALQATDAMITQVPGVVLVVMVADCVPIVLYDPVTHTVAAVHAGWGGTVRGVTPATLAALADLGVDPADLIACIGPSIAPNRYQVGSEVADAAAAAFGDRWARVLRPCPDTSGRWLFDLWAAAAVQLAEGGVPEANIHVSAQDTGPGTPFYSHRCEAPTGRFALVARLKETP